MSRCDLDLSLTLNRVADRVSCDQSMYQIWVRSIDPRLSYWCTKFGQDIVRSSTQIKSKNGEDTLHGFQTTAVQTWVLLSDMAKNRSFWPPVKIERSGGDVPRDCSRIHYGRTNIWSAAAVRFDSYKFELKNAAAKRKALGLPTYGGLKRKKTFIKRLLRPSDIPCRAA